jgi:hypothetical protein
MQGSVSKSLLLAGLLISLLSTTVADANKTVAEVVSVDSTKYFGFEAVQLTDDSLATPTTKLQHSSDSTTRMLNHPISPVVQLHSAECSPETLHGPRI